MAQVYVICVLVLLCIYTVQSQLIFSVLPYETKNSVVYTIENDDTQSHRFLSYGTPFEGQIFFPILNISRNGEIIPYVGPIARRVNPPPPTTFIEIPAKSKLSINIDLSNYFELSDDTYEINIRIPEFNPTLSDVIIGSSIILDLFTSRPSPKALANTYTNCSSKEKGEVDSAASAALSQSNAAEACMKKNSCNTLTDKWFGSTSTKNTGYYDYDEGVFVDVSNRLSVYGINAYCNPTGCENGVYAYVYPSDPKYTVHLCSAFWNQPGERANTIVHEMSHFTTLGGTVDYAYGKPACTALADSNPYQASHNADNVCYFSAEA